MLYLEIYTNKLAENGRRLIRKAYNEARNRDHYEITPEHIFSAFAEIERPFFNEIMQSLNLDPQAVLQALETKLGQRHTFGRGIKMSESFRLLLQNAHHHAKADGRPFIEPADLFIAIFKDEKSHLVKLLKRFGADREIVVQKIQSYIRSQENLAMDR